jgi:hypothetical protein
MLLMCREDSSGVENRIGRKDEFNVGNECKKIENVTWMCWMELDVVVTETGVLWSMCYAITFTLCHKLRKAPLEAR